MTLVSSLVWLGEWVQLPIPCEDQGLSHDLFQGFFFSSRAFLHKHAHIRTQLTAWKKRFQMPGFSLFISLITKCVLWTLAALLSMDTQQHLHNSRSWPQIPSLCSAWKLKAVRWAHGRSHLVCFSSLTAWFPVSWKLIFYAFYLFLFFGARGEG